MDLVRECAVVGGCYRRHDWVMTSTPECSGWDQRTCTQCGLVRRTVRESHSLSRLDESSWTAEDYALHAPFDAEDTRVS
jgi:hypothetical protein